MAPGDNLLRVIIESDTINFVVVAHESGFNLSSANLPHAHGRIVRSSHYILILQGISN